MHRSLISAALTEGRQLHRTQEELGNDSSPLDAVATLTYRSGEVSNDFFTHIPGFSGYQQEYLPPYQAKPSDRDRANSKVASSRNVPVSESQARYLSNWHQPSQYSQRYQRLQPGCASMTTPESLLLTGQDCPTSRRLDWLTGSSHHLVNTLRFFLIERFCFGDVDHVRLFWSTWQDYDNSGIYMAICDNQSTN